MKYIRLSAALALLLAGACAKTPATETNAASKVFFDAWVELHNDNWTRTPLGCYIIEEEAGEGAEVLADTTDNHYLWVEFTATTLQGSLSSFSDAQSARQMNVYKEQNYYGPRVWQRGVNTLYAGVDDAMVGMKEGGRRKFAMPGWLGTYVRYGSEQGYYKNATGTAAVYDVRLVRILPPLYTWELDSLRSYVGRHFPQAGEPVSEGLYYVRRKAPRNDVPLAADSTYYINYVARCLDGRVFDTNIRDTAVFYGIWSNSRTYGPSSVKWASSADKITLGGNSVISGFSKTLLQMGRYEAGTGMFVSSLGYSSSGSGDAIPPFSPLRFDIELCDKE